MEEEGDLCPICQEALRGSGESLDCGHVFHARCIIPWFRQGNQTCPLCRDNPHAPEPEPEPEPGPASEPASESESESESESDIRFDPENKSRLRALVRTRERAVMRAHGTPTSKRLQRAYALKQKHVARMKALKKDKKYDTAIRIWRAHQKKMKKVQKETLDEARKIAKKREERLKKVQKETLDEVWKIAKKSKERLKKIRKTANAQLKEVTGPIIKLATHANRQNNQIREVRMDLVDGFTLSGHPGAEFSLGQLRTMEHEDEIQWNTRVGHPDLPGTIPYNELSAHMFSLIPRVSHGTPMFISPDEDEPYPIAARMRRLAARTSSPSYRRMS
jgi:hypothetical protein